MSDKKYFFIDPSDLPRDKEIFPFNLFIYNPVNGHFYTFLHANSPLTKELKSKMEILLQKKIRLAVSYTQKRTFLNDLGKKEEEIAGLRAAPVHELVKQREEKLKELAKNKKDAIIPGKMLPEIVRQSLQRDDLTTLITSVRDEIQIFPVNISPAVSLAIKLAYKCMNEDNMTNRTVALAFSLSKIMGMDKPADLGELVCASFLHHLGQTQMDLSLIQKPIFDLGEKELKDYKKHPGLSHHLIRKSGLSVGDRAIKIILEHHERADGSGYPAGKKSSHLDPLSLMLGLCSHIIEYSAGIITGTKFPLQKVIQSYAHRSTDPGLDYQFGDSLYQAFVEMTFDTTKLKKKAA